MTPKSTVYQFSIQISDVDRSLYHDEKLAVALHPSESAEFMMTRLIAWCLEYGEGIAFSRGIGAPDEPTVSTKELDGVISLWVEIGAPSPDRLHRAAKAAKRVSVYCHRSAEQVYQQLTREPIFNGEQIAFYSFDEGFVTGLCAALDRRNELSLSRTEGVLYATLNRVDLTSILQERRLR
jgi:uncharacterized protein YaeQ